MATALRATLIASLAGFFLPGAQALPAGDDDRLERRQTVVSTEDRPNGHRWTRARILVQAPVAVVWDTVHEERKRDPDLAYSKVLSQEHNRATLEQKFVLIPVIGAATCVLANEEKPLERIDYWLLKSDRFKAMEGSWVLKPHHNGKSTILELSTYIDTGFPVPRNIMDAITARKLERRLGNVRRMAEGNHKQLAHQP